jgi:hypothetical protein
MQAQPSKEDQNLKIKRPKKTSVGFPAVLKAMQHVKQEMGLIKGNLLLLKVNQTKGFDCLGCAWADPAERSMFEFCENGAKGDHLFYVIYEHDNWPTGERQATITSSQGYSLYLAYRSADDEYSKGIITSDDALPYFAGKYAIDNGCIKFNSKL